jgi:ribonuclease D
MKKMVPSKAETALLEPFVGLTLDRIHVPATKGEFASATAEIKAAAIVGFDTESKPTFVTGDVSEGPHIVQFAVQSKAFIFQLHRADCRQYLIELLQSEDVLKVGFGLKSDSGQIHTKLGVTLRAVLDLNNVFKEDGYRSAMGVRAAVGMVFCRRFAKSKKITTSNWALPQLTPKQLLYAANDAFAALKVLEALNRPHENLPITGLTIRPQLAVAADLKL